jgi:signal transduction histidine kinase
MPVSRVDHGAEAALGAAATSARPDDPSDAAPEVLTQQVRHLTRRNQDLDAFARHLAHELRTPLGHLAGLNDLLQGTLDPTPGTPAANLLRLQREATAQMIRLVDDLLAMARADQEPLDACAVDLAAMCRELLPELPPVAGRAAPVDWQFEPLPPVQGAPGLLRMVLGNLLSNAAKYTRDTPAPRVRVCGERRADGRLVVRVQDNGIGFDPARAAELFQPFVRLHDGQHADGIGVGLSIAQRIVERHGGTIVADSVPGQGASFLLDLPTADTVAA